eukprot:CAMPEP_0184080328 /NCGR_PEP_ID=MMETSP0974-20121125/2143_1 /TAXON_ID=483370 /ORGANISM="non described non described, Strain CCMP2097" /LENGTH=1169 /DNA_ID=CAMNT_0026382987 /DNA_START=181 /DNA_END=3691 /DNA_ORIENTATION=-
MRRFAAPKALWVSLRRGPCSGASRRRGLCQKGVGDAARLQADIDAELSKQRSYAANMQGKSDWQDDVDDLVRARRETSGAWTAEETALLDRFAHFKGMADFDELMRVMSDKFPQQDPLRSRVELLAMARKPPLSEMLRFDPAVLPPSLHGVMASRFELLLRCAPSVDPATGFAANFEVDASFDRLRADLAKFIDVTRAWSASYMYPLDPRDCLKSPFGPVSSSACYEELGRMSLTNLKGLHATMGRAVPYRKLLLTVVRAATVSPSGCVSALVEDEAGQRVLLQIFGVEPKLTPTVDGVDALALHGRYYLRNPFLKINAENWLMLRVDQPFDLLRLDVPPLRGRILVVGDGDFSFSKALAAANARRGEADITCSSLEPQEGVCAKYAGAAANLAALAADPFVVVAHGVDATRLEHSCGDGTWDSVVWNFPYLPSMPLVSGEQGARLLGDFLGGVGAFLKPGGRVYVTLATKQGGTTREAVGNVRNWDVDALAAATGFEVVEVLPFDAHSYAGYEPRREYTDSSFPFERARTHILQRRASAAVGAAPSERSVEARLASFNIDKEFFGTPEFRHVPLSVALDSLSQSAATSPTARRLLRAAVVFQQVNEIIRDTPYDQELFDLVPFAMFVVERLASVYSTPNADLVASWEDKEYRRALVFARLTIVSRLLVATGAQPAADGVTQLFAAVISDETSAFSVALDYFVRASAFRIQAPRGYESVHCGLCASAFLVTACLERYRDVDAAWAVVDIGCRLGLDDARLYLKRAEYNNGRFSARGTPDDAASRALLSAVVRDCDAALDRNADDTEALWAKSYALKSSEETLDTAYSALVAFIARAAPCNRFLPSAHYHAGLLRAAGFAPALERQRGTAAPFDEDQLDEARVHYVAGLRAEEETRIPFFGPDLTDSKRLLAIILIEKRPKGSSKKQAGAPAPADSSMQSTGTAAACTKEAAGSAAPAGTSAARPTIVIDDVAALLDETAEILLADFRNLYESKFGKTLQVGKLKAALQRAELAGACRLEERAKGGCGSLVRPTVAAAVRPTVPAAGVRPTIPAAEIDAMFASDVRALLGKRDEVSSSVLKPVFEAEFGRPLAGAKKLSAALKAAAGAGACALEVRGTEIWVTRPKATVAAAKKKAPTAAKKAPPPAAKKKTSKTWYQEFMMKKLDHSDS